jgi:hypothetical protein
MAGYSVPQLLSIINRQVGSQETLSEYLSKAEALVYVAMNDEFFNYPELIIHNYLWTLNDILEKAKQVNEEALNILLKNVPSEIAFSTST